jgi:CheY-like chemotaxis protein
MLVADDDENDRMLVRLAIKRNHVRADIREVHDGVEAIRYLRGEGEYSDRQQYPFPDLLLMDLKMPRMDGLGVLEWLRTHPDCSFLPTVMMSGSGQVADVLEAHRRGVKAYFVKPSDLKELEKVVGVIAEHWATARRPNMPARCG